MRFTFLLRSIFLFTLLGLFTLTGCEKPAVEEEEMTNAVRRFSSPSSFLGNTQGELLFGSEDFECFDDEPFVIALTLSQSHTLHVVFYINTNYTGDPVAYPDDINLELTDSHGTVRTQSGGVGHFSIQHGQQYSLSIAVESDGGSLNGVAVLANSYTRTYCFESEHYVALTGPGSDIPASGYYLNMLDCPSLVHGEGAENVVFDNCSGSSGTGDSTTSLTDNGGIGGATAIMVRG